jgi:hypothetical protein
MTTQQLLLFSALYLPLLVVVIILTRATARRVVGAMAGGLVVGVMLLGIVRLGEGAGLWHMAIPWEPFFLLLFVISMALAAFVFLITWRIARRWGWRGLAAVVLFAAIIGPPRDYWYMSRFPEWGSYAPGIAPVLAISAAYVLMILVGHGVMRLVAGPANADPLARRSWEPKPPNTIY